MNPWDLQWVVDTAAFTRFGRAGHLEIFQRLAPKGLLVIPDVVFFEADAGRDKYQGVPDANSLHWVELAVLTRDEDWTSLAVKGQLGGTNRENLGECTVIAVAKHRGMLAILDDYRARIEASEHSVDFRMSLWVVLQAHMHLDYDREKTIRVVDDLLATGMRLGITSGASLFDQAYHEGWLPEDPEELRESCPCPRCA